MQEYTSPSERLKALTDQLEQGVSDIFQSGQYAAYLMLILVALIKGAERIAKEMFGL